MMQGGVKNSEKSADVPYGHLMPEKKKYAL